MTGRYEITERIATGGMAEIYKGKTRGADGFEKTVVIKRILPEYTQDPDFIRMFVREAKLSTLLDHPNIVQVFDLGKVGEEYFITMEYVDGPNLHAAAVRAFKMGYRPFPLKECLFVLAETCKGLDHAHRKVGPDGKPLGIIHRDISPPNILLSFDGHVKVGDFGVAKARDQAVRTRTGVLKGKFGYMSPEQAQGNPLDARSDVFALGIVLWELLAGKRLFKGASPLQTIERVSRCEVPLLASFFPEIPPEIDALVARAMARETVDRFQSAAEFGDAISDYLFAANLRVGTRDLSAFLRHVFMDARTESGEPLWKPQPMPRALPKLAAISAPRMSGTIAGEAPDTEIMSSVDPSYSEPSLPAEKVDGSAKYKGGTLLQFSPIMSAVEPEPVPVPAAPVAPPAPAAPRGVPSRPARPPGTMARVEAAVAPPPSRTPSSSGGSSRPSSPSNPLQAAGSVGPSGPSSLGAVVVAVAPSGSVPTAAATPAARRARAPARLVKRRLTWLWWTLGVIALSGVMVAVLYLVRRA